MNARAVVVTGGFGALGRVVCAMAAARGWRVAAVDVSKTEPPDLAPGPTGMIVAGADLASAAGAARAVEAAAQAFGGLDGLINIAGGFRWQTVAEGDPEVWEQLHRLNLGTTLHASRAALPYLIAGGRGRIVNVGANAAIKAAAGMGAYAASKAGVHRLTESLAEELKDKGVTVNAVLPSIIDTPANRADMPDADWSRWVTPQALAEVILFLASDEAAAVTGALVPVMGRV